MSCLVNISKKPGFRDLLADDIPGRVDEGVFVVHSDTRRCRECLKEGQEPVAARVASEPGCFGKVERQIVRQQSMPEFRLGLRNDLVRLRQFLDIVDARADRIEVGLRRADPEHVEDDLGVLRIVLVPAVMQSLPRSCERDRRNEAKLETCLKQTIRQRSVIVAGRFETREHRSAKILEQRDEMIVFRPRVGHDQPPSASPSWHLDQHVIAVLGNVDGYQRGIRLA